MRGFFEGITIANQHAIIGGWIVDPLLFGGGIPPVAAQILIDGISVAKITANFSRPDLVVAGVAPNPEHGFSVSLDAATVKLLQHGIHEITIMATSSISPLCQFVWLLHPNGFILPTCVDDGIPCRCPANSIATIIVSAYSIPYRSSFQRPVI